MPQRRPGREALRGVGDDPDARFSLANERTFLAWIRTALALDAAGLGVIQFLPSFGIPFGSEVVGGFLVLLGTVTAATSYRRWRANELALRTGDPLPGSRMPQTLAIGVALVSLLALAVALAGAG